MATIGTGGESSAVWQEKLSPTQPKELSPSQRKNEYLNHLKETGHFPFTPPITYELLQNLGITLMEAVDAETQFQGCCRYEFIVYFLPELDSTSANSVAETLCDRKDYAHLNDLLAYKEVVQKIHPSVVEGILNKVPPEEKQKLLSKVSGSDNRVALLQKGASLQLYRMLLPHDLNPYILKLYDEANTYGANPEIKETLKALLEKLYPNLLANWEGDFSHKDIEAVRKEMVDKFQDELGDILQNDTHGLRAFFVRYCSDIHPAVWNYVVENNQFDQVVIFPPKYQLTADKVTLLSLNSLHGTSGGVQQLKDNVFVVFEPAALPTEWKNKVGETNPIASGAVSTFSIVPVIEFEDTGDVKVKQMGMKTLESPRVKQNLVNIYQIMEGKDLPHVEKLHLLLKEGGISFVKYYKKGDARHLPQLTAETSPQELQHRKTILLDACKGAQELKELGLFQIDFRTDNIFLKKEGAVLGDLSGLLNLSQGAGYMGFIISPIHSSGNLWLLEDELKQHGPTEKARKLAEEEVCFNIAIAAKNLFYYTDNPSITKMFKNLENAKTIESSIKILVESS